MRPRHPLSWLAVAATALLLSPVAAQSNSTASLPSSTSASLTPSVSATTTSATITTTLRSGTALIPVTTVIPVVFNVTVTPTPTSTSAAADSTSPSATPTPDPRHLDTKLDPGFGVLGALLILTGIPSAFLGHKNRWTSFFLIGFYTLSLVCFVLILKFGILQAVNPPSTTLRGLFVLASCVAGFVGGGVSIFFWRATRYFVGGWGGLVFALWIQCFRDGGLIHEIGFRWILYIACGVIGFVLCTIPKLHYYILIISTSFVGATSFMLGVDCFTSANLKEFYIWNLGFNSLYQKYEDHGIQFPVSQTMEIELGLMGAVALMGIAVQLRILNILQRKLREIKEEQRRLDVEAEARAAAHFADVEREKEEWEREHPTLLKHGRNDSNLSHTPLMKDTELGLSTPSDEKRASTFTLPSGTRQRVQSGVSSLMLNSPPIEDRPSQSPGPLPTLDLGVDLERDVPQNYISEDLELRQRVRSPSLTLSVAQDLEDLKKKQELLSEIQNIRKSIEILKSETPAPESSTDSARPSFSSRLEFGALPVPGPSHLRPPRPNDPRSRVQSMELSNLRAYNPSPVGRPTSVPLQDEAWDTYLRERKLLQPPSGVTPPIPTSPPVASPTPRLAVPSAVTAALLQRQRRESSLSFGQVPSGADRPPSAEALGRRSLSNSKTWSPEELPPALRPQPHQKSASQSSFAPGIILPPRGRNASSPPPPKESANKVMSFEELEERHREKLRQLQQPLTQAEKEQAEIQAAKMRWERAKERERQAVLKRQAEQAAAASKEAKDKKRASEVRRNSVTLNDERPVTRHSRTLSADALAAVGGKSTSSKRLSTMKVEDWQKTQTATPDARPRREPRRGSGVPFPDRRPSGEARRISIARDPPS
ncbi:atrophin-1 family-like protein [Phanerochaete sordida]|uniref:Atrophin-1 family-like protein n=1 Tax=Phanerochaete sordida TaxID=48140 RepID=A0A9P3FYS8_9APHY|nr:atrophin-1 family-like protein [Phanerochaete sordida]